MISYLWVNGGRTESFADGTWPIGFRKENQSAVFVEWDMYKATLTFPFCVKCKKRKK